MRLLLACLLLVVTRLTAATQPNVIVMLADDAGWGDYSFNGNRQLATPNLDALAKGDCLAKFVWTRQLLYTLVNIFV